MYVSIAYNVELTIKLSLLNDEEQVEWAFVMEEAIHEGVEGLEIGSTQDWTSFLIFIQAQRRGHKSLRYSSITKERA